MENAKITFIPFSFCPQDEKYISEMYRLCKDQERKLFDLTENITNLLDHIQECLEQPNSIYLAACDDQGKVCAIFSLENIFQYKNIILEAEQHVVFARHCWGKKAREIVEEYYKYLDENLKPIKRLVASVPQHNFGVIKLLKDMGFHLEGTLKDKLLYKNKNGDVKFYNQLVYSRINKEITPDVIR